MDSIALEVERVGVSGKRCIGPQLNYVGCLSDVPSGLIASKSFSEIFPSKHSKSKVSRLIEDFLHCHQQLHRTGTSSMLFYLTHLSSFLRQANCPQAVKMECLNILRSVFEETYHALTLDVGSNSTGTGNPSSIRTNQNAHQSDEYEGFDADDVSWFFTSDDKRKDNSAPEFRISSMHAENQADISSDLNCTTSGGAESQIFYSDSWLAKGLDHCIRCDYNSYRLCSSSSYPPFSISPDGNGETVTVTAGNNVSLSRPMELALNAARALWTSCSSDFSDDRKSSVCRLLGERVRRRRQCDNSNSNSSSNSNSYLTRSDRLSVENLAVHRIPYASAGHSRVFPGSVICLCDGDTVARVMQLGDDRGRGSVRVDEEKDDDDGEGVVNMNETSSKYSPFEHLPHGHSQQRHHYLNPNNSCRVFQRAAVIGGPIWDVLGSNDGDDNGNVGGWTSEQACSLDYLIVHGPANPLPSLSYSNSRMTSGSSCTTNPCNNSDSKSNNNGDMYLRKALVHLRHLDVSLLFCPAHSFSARLLDACHSAGVAVIPVDRSTLRLVSLITGAEPASSILELTADSTGTHAVEVSSLSIPVIGKAHSDDGFAATVETVLVISRLSFSSDDRGSQMSESSLRSVDLIGPGRSSPPSSSYSTSTTTNYVNIASVIVAGATAAQTQALEDRFYRCLHRLRAFVDGAGIVPGAGLPELLCCMELDSRIYELQKRLRDLKTANHEYKYESNNDLSAVEDICDKIELLSSAKHMFRLYILTVSTNNGATWMEACDAFERSAQCIRKEFHLSTGTSSSFTSGDCNGIERETHGASSSGHFHDSVLEALKTARAAGNSTSFSSLESRLLNIPSPIYIASTSSSSSSSSSSFQPSNASSPLFVPTVDFDDSNSWNVVLDVADIKVSAFQNAVSAVRALVGANVIHT